MSEEESRLRFQLEKLTKFDPVGILVERALIEVSVESHHIHGLRRQSLRRENRTSKVL